MMHKGLCFGLLLSLGLASSSCATLEKYSPKLRGADKAPTQRGTQVAQAVNPASIFALDGNTFRFQLSFGRVWNSALDVLLENYNLNIVDRKSGVITTEWDSFYLDSKVYRNKVSLRIKKLAYNMVDVTIHNSVETLQSVGAGGVSSAWLPHPKSSEEMGRLVHNMAINLGQPRPVLPNEMIATSVKEKEEVAR